MKDTLLLRRSNYSSTIIYGLLCGLFFGLSVWASYHGISDWSARAQKGFWNQMGFLSLFLSFGSASFWFFKKRVIKAKSANRDAFPWANSAVISWFREAHITLGWVAFTLGVGHSVFYLINLQPRRNHVFSGVVVLGLMSALVITGLLYKHKIISLRTIKNAHKILACMFGVLLLTHI